MPSTLRRFAAFARLTRPVFLLGGALLYGVGAALARATGSALDPGRYLLGQAMVTAVQLSAQYANEHFDQETDRHAAVRRTWLTGGSGVPAAGVLGPATALRAAVVATAASVAAIGAALAVEPAAGAVGMLALAGSWAYSARPVRLVATPWGVLTASIIVAGLTPLTGLIIQGARTWRAWMAVAVPLVLIHAAMLIAFEQPDEAADRATSKATLTVRLGSRRARLAHDAALVAAFGWLLLASGRLGLPGPAVGLGMIGVAPAAGQILAIHRRSTSDGLLVTGAVAVLVVTAAGILAGLVR